MKNNPLFSDSTKLWTDTITMKIELEALFLYEDEEVYFRYIVVGGGERKVPLRYNGEGLFVGETNMSHHKEFSYHFMVMREGETAFTSQVKQGRTSYFLSDTWTPSFQPEAAASPVKTTPDELGSIIDRWGL